LNKNRYFHRDKAVFFVIALFVWEIAPGLAVFYALPRSDSPLKKSFK
jgi:hypothetical protein